MNTHSRLFRAKKFALFSTMLTLACMARPLPAQTLWNLDVEGDWHDASNWTAGVPNSSTTARINLGTSVLDGDATASAVQLGFAPDSAGRFEVRPGATLSGMSLSVGHATGSDSFLLIDGGHLTFNSTPAFSQAWVGATGAGEMQILGGGTLLSLSSSIARFSGSSGEALVSGTGSLWAMTGDMSVGHAATGSLAVSHGGRVLANATVIGRLDGSSGALLLTEGGILETGALSRGTGTGHAIFEGGILRVGATPSDPANYIQGFAADGLVLAGAGLTFDTNGQDVGVGATFSGTGDFTKTGDGILTLNAAQTYTGTTTVEQGTLRIASASHLPQSKIYDVRGGFFDLSGVAFDLRPSSGVAELTVRDGGEMRNADVFLGGSSGAAVATVTGEGSLWTHTGFTRIGNNGRGELLIENGGRVVGEYGWVAAMGAGDGHVTVRGEGSEWHNNIEVIVGLGGSGTLLVEQGGRVVSTLASWISFGPNEGTVIVRGAGSEWQSAQLNMASGFDSKAGLFVEDGARVSSAGATVGFGGEATAVITGTDSRWEIGGSLQVGAAHISTLSVREGGFVSNTTATIGAQSTGHGTVTIDGASSRWDNSGGIIIGDSGTGILEIGGGLVSNMFTAIAHSAGSVGEVSISGGTWINSTSLNVGAGGQGSLNISGGEVRSQYGFIGGEVGSNGEALVSGGTWMSTWSFEVGVFGSGTLDIIGGSVFSNNVGVIGQNEGSTGIVNVTGGTLGIAGDLIVGDQGSGSLNISGSGLVQMGGNLSANDSASIHLNGGTLSIGGFGAGGREALTWDAGTLRITGTGGFGVGAGQFQFLTANQRLEVSHTLTAESGATLFSSETLAAGTLLVTETARVFLDGPTNDFGSAPGTGLINRGDTVFGNASTVSGRITNEANITALRDVTFTGPVTGPGGFFGGGEITFEGGYSPGSSPGAVFFESDLTLADTNVLTMEIGGLTPGSGYDQIHVGGLLALGGTMNLLRWDAFNPSLGDSFQLFNFGSITGDFHTLNLFSLDNGLAWDTSGISTFGTLNVVPEPSTALLLGLGSLALGFFFRRRGKRSGRIFIASTK